jgi:hypothetical protein
MIVIPHNDEAVHDYGEAKGGILQVGKELLVISPGEEDTLPLIAPRRDVVESAFVFDSERTGRGVPPERT